MQKFDTPVVGNIQRILRTFRSRVQDLGYTQAITATSGGVTADAQANHLEVTSSSANNKVILPAATAGKKITGFVGANGFKLGTDPAGAIKINNVDSHAAAAAIVANSYFEAVFTGNDWVLRTWTNLGAPVTAIVPA